MKYSEFFFLRHKTGHLYLGRCDLKDAKMILGIQVIWYLYTFVNLETRKKAKNVVKSI
jgi:hypothetical protein